MRTPHWPSILALAGTAAVGATPRVGATPSSAPVAQHARSPLSPVGTQGRDSVVRLVGRFSPSQQRTGALAPTGQAKVFGNIVLKPTDGDATRTHVVLDITTQESNITIAWALHPGQCGSPTLPLLAVNVFPAIDLGTTGRGHVEADLPLEFPTSGQFHANVYNDGTGQGLENVMTCAALRFDRQKAK